ncbi:alpha-glucuronidase family glycosyl hydrolase [Litchfieldia salsa]|uniref:Xylan alpha-1,2-glucuronidase n=1 Tax=Litchfieldia salsa TaxID=930152 RepID=A0A1H0PBW2_9BACI|nr:alpha-glucuronidase family glycosyl hydrolase [Litchfieldia salsa]SDP02250.1 alpha-glucuronidase [Litchfieldia salsa]
MENQGIDIQVDRLRRTEYDDYSCWLQYTSISNREWVEHHQSLLSQIIVLNGSMVVKSAKQELFEAIKSMAGITPTLSNELTSQYGIVLATYKDHPSLTDHLSSEEFQNLNEEGYIITSFHSGSQRQLLIVGKTDIGVLYATFHLLRLIKMEENLDDLYIVESPKNQIRMINEWDNMDGSIERGYAGDSIYYENNRFTGDVDRLKDYARLLSSVGINGVSINNVNVHEIETNLITSRFLPDVARVAEIFRAYGIKTFLSANYASSIQLGGLDTADPLDKNVQECWIEKVKEIYSYIPDFGGFVVKADSEHRPGPFTYNRNHADGANMLARALKPFGGIVFWRCFVYNCLQDWRDRSTDRAKAAYDHFKPLDGEFLDNVVLQIKNGPMDFQVREPVSPLFGSMPNTNQVLEFQVSQEYTGQQKHLCYLVPQWKGVLDFDTYAVGEGATVKRIVNGELYNYQNSGITAVSNIGNDRNWTGHSLAQANFYGYGRLIWNPDLTAEEITEEWIRLTFGNDSEVVASVSSMLLKSWEIYENYTAPLGVGWMVNTDHHYGPNVDGYEYSVWGTYHFADCHGIGVNRTLKDGTGYTGQYFKENKDQYESVETCPDELLLFFHYVPYTHRLKSGVTVIQHIYNTHFEGVEQADKLVEDWKQLEGKIDYTRFGGILNRLQEQAKHSREWRDQINTYFYRKSGINDDLNRKIY